jgi:serine/threonine protein kinase
MKPPSATGPARPRMAERTHIHSGAIVPQKTDRAEIAKSVLTTQCSVLCAREWRITQLLSLNSHFSIYRAATMGDLGPGCYVLKSIKAGGTIDELSCSMLLREASIAKSVIHTSLISVLAEEFDPRPYLVLPYLDGVTLRHLIRARPGSLPVIYALSLVRQAAEALAALHSANWLHGELRPEHVIVSPEGQATLIDLTRARRIASAECRIEAAAVQSPRYAAPEFFSSRAQLTIASDIYSLGVMLFELLSGRMPFPAESYRELANCHRCESSPELRSFRADAGREVNELCRRMLAKEPLRRPDASQVVRWLAELEIAELAV